MWQPPRTSQTVNKLTTLLTLTKHDRCTCYIYYKYNLILFIMNTCQVEVYKLKYACNYSMFRCYDKLWKLQTWKRTVNSTFWWKLQSKLITSIYMHSVKFLFKHLQRAFSIFFDLLRFSWTLIINFLKWIPVYDITCPSFRNLNIRVVNLSCG